MILFKFIAAVLTAFFLRIYSQRAFDDFMTKIKNNEST